MRLLLEDDDPDAQPFTRTALVAIGAAYDLMEAERLGLPYGWQCPVCEEALPGRVAVCPACESGIEWSTPPVADWWRKQETWGSDNGNGRRFTKLDSAPRCACGATKRYVCPDCEQIPFP